MIYLLVLLGGLVLGLYPHFVWSSRAAVEPVPLPILATISTSQAMFLLMIHPVVILRRLGGRREQNGRAWLVRTVLETLVFLLIGVPVYLLVGVLGDNSPTDVIRCVLLVATAWPVGWALGRLLARGGAWLTAGMLLMIVGGLGLPALWYVLAEFSPQISGGWLLDASLPTLVWRNAMYSRGAIPEPTWAWLVWILAGPVIGVVLWTTGKSRNVPAGRE
ncbi:MAG: hypothetical protein ACLFV7_10440 [Phycisphaerae bacterium]